MTELPLATQRYARSGDPASWLTWFRTPHPLVIASDPPGYEIHKMPADAATGHDASYELRLLTGVLAHEYETIGTSHLCDIAMCAGERDYQTRKYGAT